MFKIFIGFRDNNCHKLFIKIFREKIIRILQTLASKTQEISKRIKKNILLKSNHNTLRI